MEELLVKVNQYIINPVLGFLFIAAFAFFLWGVTEYFLQGDSVEARKTGKQHILWGIVGLLIMAGFWGIIQILANTIGVSVRQP